MNSNRSRVTIEESSSEDNIPPLPPFPDPSNVGHNPVIFQLGESTIRFYLLYILSTIHPAFDDATADSFLSWVCRLTSLQRIHNYLKLKDSSELCAGFGLLSVPGGKYTVQQTSALVLELYSYEIHQWALKNGFRWTGEGIFGTESRAIIRSLTFPLQNLDSRVLIPDNQMRPHMLWWRTLSAIEKLPEWTPKLDSQDQYRLSRAYFQASNLRIMGESFLHYSLVTAFYARNGYNVSHRFFNLVIDFLTSDQFLGKLSFHSRLFRQIHGRHRHSSMLKLTYESEFADQLKRFIGMLIQESNHDNASEYINFMFSSFLETSWQDALEIIKTV